MSYLGVAGDISNVKGLRCRHSSLWPSRGLDNLYGSIPVWVEADLVTKIQEKVGILVQMHNFHACTLYLKIGRKTKQRQIEILFLSLIQCEGYSHNRFWREDMYSRCIPTGFKCETANIFSPSKTITGIWLRQSSLVYCNLSEKYWKTEAANNAALEKQCGPVSSLSLRFRTTMNKERTVWLSYEICVSLKLWRYLLTTVSHSQRGTVYCHYL